MNGEEHKAQWPEEDSWGEKALLVRLLAPVLIFAAVVVAVVAFLWTSGRSGVPDASSGATAEKREDTERPLEQAREALRRATDLNACRGAVQQLNAHLTEAREDRPPGLTAAARRTLEEVGLTPDELAEAEAGGYTLLDAHHLDACFLFRDAAERLGVGAVAAEAGGSAVRRPPAEQAAAAFAWAVRQVRLAGAAAEPVPPQFAVRRGTGTPLERALVFLALLDGFTADEGRLHGCLVWVPEKQGKPPRLWACGVLPPTGTDVYLFDPRLGLPIPGPGGAGVATLADVRKDPAVLRQLTVDDAHRYDVTPEQAAAAELTVVCPLSALAPRMRHLQDKLLPPAVRVRLACDAAGELARWTAAAGALGGPPPAVRVWREGVGLLRRFLPAEEGGSDEPRGFPLRALEGFTTADDPAVVPMTRKRLFELTLAPWPAFPPQLRDPNRFPYTVPLGQRVRDGFARPFVRAALEPGQPRDLLLRGDVANAPEQLVQERDRLQEQAAAFRDQRADLARRVDAWVAEAIPAFAQALRARGGSAEEQAAANARLEDLWKRAEPVAVLLGGAVAGPRGAEVTYQLGLCKQEDAEGRQARLDLLARAGVTPPPTEVAQAREAWRAARKWWVTYAEENPNGPALAAARRLQARAELALGNREAAVALLEDLSGPLTPFDQLAALLEARRVKGGK